jgi:hypothetical protein
MGRTATAEGRVWLLLRSDAGESARSVVLLQLLRLLGIVRRLLLLLLLRLIG